MNQHTVIHEQSGINSFYSKIYSLVGVGVGISAVVSALMMTLFQETFMYILTQAPWVYYIAIAVELILVLVASRQSVKNNPMALPLFLTYSALNGFTLSFIIARYAQATVYKAFVVSALMFFIMSAIGHVTKKDLSGMGRAFMGALIGIIIASIANIFLQSSGMDYVLSILCVIIFAGLTAWDNQKIRYVYEQSNSQSTNGWVVALALELYLDFINLFINILRIFGRND